MAMRRFVVIALGAAGAAMALLPLGAVAACRYNVPATGPIDIQDLQEMTLYRECGALVDELAKRLEVDPLLIAINPELDPEDVEAERADTLEFARLRRLKVLLAEGDRTGALQRIEQLLANANPKGTVHWALTGEPQPDGTLDGETASPGIIDILEGKVPAAPRPIPAVGANWELMFGWCGTPAASWHHDALNQPIAADAWLGVNRPDLALNALLVDQWVSGLSLGMAPPRLREFGERFMGPGTYAREVERALAGIQILEGPDGRRATLPMFGELLPVPLGYRTWNAAEPTIFQTPADIASYLRPLLLGRE